LPSNGKYERGAGEMGGVERMAGRFHFWKRYPSTCWRWEFVRALEKTITSATFPMKYRDKKALDRETRLDPERVPLNAELIR
jgi:hypothetical protein